MLSAGGVVMICGSCGKRMKIGKFIVGVHGVGAMSSYAYPTISWYEGDNLVAETDKSETTGFFCQDCGIVAGVFFRVRQVGFTKDYDYDIDDSIDKLPKKSCPECNTELDIDYPRCPECGYVF